MTTPNNMITGFQVYAIALTGDFRGNRSIVAIVMASGAVGNLNEPRLLAQIHFDSARRRCR